MIHTSITPVSTKVSVSIPKEYIGKKVEILLYSEEEAKEEHPDKKSTMSAFWGILNSKDAKELRKHVEKSRDEWERAIQTKSC